jgi:hypothetical protein
MLAVGLTVLASLAALGADKPIPQDAARMEQRARERLEWNRRTLRGAYDKVGKKSPRWDDAAHEALELAAGMFSSAGDPPIVAFQVHAPAKKAVEAGCDDPLVLYLYARTSVGPNFPRPPGYSQRIQAAATAMAASSSSPFRRATAVMAAIESEAARKNLTPEQSREIELGLDAVLDLLSKSVAEDMRSVDWEDRWFEQIKSVIALRTKLGGDSKAAFDGVDAKLAQIRGIEPLRLTLKGDFQINWAWESRTGAPARDVTPEQFRIFAERLQEARAALALAWKENPAEPHVARLMMIVEKGMGQGDRQAMETWFERAMTADGNDLEACLQKLDWLDPRWHGGDTHDEMMAFARQCAATGNWRSGITLISC